MSIFIGFALAFMSIVAVFMAIELLPRMTKHPADWRQALSYNRYGNSISPIESLVARLEKALTAQLGQSAVWSPAKTEGQGKNLRLLLSQKAAGVTAMELRIFLERTMNGGTHASWRYDCYTDFDESYFEAVCQTDEAIRACLAPPIAVPRPQAPTFAQVAQPQQAPPPVVAAVAAAQAPPRAQQPVAAQVQAAPSQSQQTQRPAPVAPQAQKPVQAPQHAQRPVAVAPQPQQKAAAQPQQKPKAPDFAQVHTPSVHLGVFQKPNYEKCPKCSKKWERDFHFCIYCGHA